MYQAAHLPSTVAEIYFNLPAVKACQFLPSEFLPLISVPCNSIHPLYLFPTLSSSYFSPFLFFTSSFPRFASLFFLFLFFFFFFLRLLPRLPLPSSAATVLPRVFQHAPPAYRFPSADGGGQGWPPPPCLAS